MSIRDIFDSMTGIQENLAYELIGQALENGDYDREALVMFNKQQRMAIELLIKEAWNS
jgi:dsDNA-binding SOS-regulon protein